MSTTLRTSGFSDAARFVQESTQRGLREIHKSRALGMAGALHEELGTVWQECREPNWDGHDALPVTQDALRNAYIFLESLPLGFPVPSIGAEPDGELTLEWYQSRRRTLSLSVSPQGELHYSALIGPNRVYGTEAFFGEVPGSILDLIQRVYAA